MSHGIDETKEEIIMVFIELYIIGIVIFLVCTAVVAGYTGEKMKLEDMLSGILWPLSIFELIGTLVRVIKENYKNRS